MLKLKTLKWALCFFLLLSLFEKNVAQDVHYSQIGNSPSTLNPGLVGVYNGTGRVIANFRNQWQAVPVSYLQLTGVYDHRFLREDESPTPFAANFSFNYDQAGDLGLSLTSFAIGGAYSVRLKKDKHHFLSAGLTMGVNQRRFDPGQATLDEQYDFKKGVDLGIPVSEVFPSTTKWYPTFGIGGNLRLQGDKKRSKLDVGIGLFNFNEPDKSFEQGPTIRQEPRLSFHAIGAVEVSEKLDVLFYNMNQFQGEYQESLFGAGVLGYLNKQKTKELAIQFSVLHRVKDAAILWGAVHWNVWQFHLSYDINGSKFNQATNFRGGPEITVIYTFKNVPKMQYCKLCPKYM